MSFFRRTPEEKAAAAALRAERERLYIAKARAKTANAALKSSEVESKQRARAARAAIRAARISGRQRVAEAKTRRVATRFQRAEEREEARYVVATDRLERDRMRGRVKPVRVRGSSRTRNYRRRRPRR